MSRGPGVGPASALLTEEERNYGRTLAGKVLRQRTVADRKSAYVAALPESDPRYADLDAKARQSEARFAELQEELLTWLGAPDGWLDLLAEVVYELAARAVKGEGP